MKSVIQTKPQINLLWTVIEYYSLENCLITPVDEGYKINSVIIGFYNRRFTRLIIRYELQKIGKPFILILFADIIIKRKP